MGRPPVKVTGKRVLDAWQSYYEDYVMKPFYPNYGMIVMAEKLADFYTMKQMHDAMSFYFHSGGRINYYDFINNIDKVMEEMATTQQVYEAMLSREEETSKIVKQIHDSKIGES